MPNKQYVARDLFTYEVDFEGLAAGQSARDTIDIQADADFAWLKSTYQADDAAANLTTDAQYPLCTVQLIDTGTDRRFFNQPVPVPAVFGLGLMPFVLPEPRLFFARSVIRVEVANFSAGTAYDLRLSLAGYKLYPQGGP